MASKRKSQPTVPLPGYDDEQINARLHQCEWPKCAETGEFRAPRSRDELNTYRWFCLGHVREYNKSWNYYDGMSEDEVEEDVRHDTVWNRPTWQLGTQLGPESLARADDPFGLFTGSGPDQREACDQKQNERDDEQSPLRPPISSEEKRAYRTLELEYPVSANDLKTQYKSLVKKHHPDANKGAKESEERLKVINEAYSVLRAALTP